MGQRLQWADISPYQSILYIVEDDNPINKKVGEVTYDKSEGKFVALLRHEHGFLRDAEIDIPSKIEAMEAVMTMMVTARFDKAK